MPSRQPRQSPAFRGCPLSFSLPSHCSSTGWLLLSRGPKAAAAISSQFGRSASPCWPQRHDHRGVRAAGGRVRAGGADAAPAALRSHATPLPPLPRALRLPASPTAAGFQPSGATSSEAVIVLLPCLDAVLPSPFSRQRTMAPQPGRPGGPSSSGMGWSDLPWDVQAAVFQLLLAPAPR